MKIHVKIEKELFKKPKEERIKSGKFFIADASTKAKEAVEDLFNFLIENPSQLQLVWDNLNLSTRI